MAGVRLKRLKIDKYRNVAPGTELVFNEGFNVLLGRNGTGKTTLLRLLAMIAKDNFAALTEQQFELSYSLAFHDVEVDVQVRNDRRKPERAREVSYFVWSYNVSFRFDNDPGSYEIKASPDGGELGYTMDGKPSRHAPNHPLPSPFAERFLRSLLARFDIDAQLQNTKHAVLKDAWTVMFEARGGRFDEGLGGFTALTEVDPDSAERDLRAATVTIVADSSGKSLSGGLTFAPDALWDAIGAKALDETIPLGHAELDFLRKSVVAMDLKGAEMLMRRRKKTIDKTNGEQTVSYAGFEFNFTLRDGDVITHDDLSYGQKRLLAFLYYAAANPDIIVADELVNGLHYEWIKSCLKEIQHRQSFLTSQNPVLLDMLPFESADDVKRSFILCSYEVNDGRGQMVWNNLTDESASAFFRAYETQALQVSEILRLNDLW